MKNIQQRKTQKTERINLAELMVWLAYLYWIKREPIDCKFCKSQETFKNGKMKGHQRYKCKSCGKSFTNTPFRGVGEEKRFLALSLYASGLSMNRISRFLGYQLLLS